MTSRPSKGASDRPGDPVARPRIRPPQDRVGVAVAWAAPWPFLVPLFFSIMIPSLRTPVALWWLVGAGILMGSVEYFARRATAYIIDKPGPGAFFGKGALLNPRRYASVGRRFVWWRLACMILFGLWWLVGASLVLPG